MKRKTNSPLWGFLVSSGALDSGDPERIRNAKKEFRKIRDRERKRKERQAKHEHVISLNGVEEERILREAQKHGLSPSNMVRVAALAYFDAAYVPPDVARLYAIEAAMKRTLSAIELVAKKERSWLSGTRDYSDVKAQVKQAYELVKAEYEKPVTLESAIVQMAKDSPTFRARILNLLK